ncbi:MAG: hypothetical protein JNK47_16360 [Mesorhizobium sp.]|nr:hypothetical protein [Mesorhizobium sp.]MBL8578796.1 hypothetical protein [Mesorhizobium sp.]
MLKRIAVCVLVFIASSPAVAADKMPVETEKQYLTPALQSVLLPSGLETVPDRECVVYAYFGRGADRKKDSIYSVWIDGYDSYRDFSIKKLYWVTLWNKYQDRKYSTLTFAYTDQNMYSIDNRWNYNKGEVDPDKAYSIFMEKKRTYPTDVANLTRLVGEVPYREFEKIFEIKNYILRQVDSQQYSIMRESCLGDRELTNKDCFCVSTSRL